MISGRFTPATFVRLAHEAVLTEAECLDLTLLAYAARVADVRWESGRRA